MSWWICSWWNCELNITRIVDLHRVEGNGYINSLLQVSEISVHPHTFFALAPIRAQSIGPIIWALTNFRHSLHDDCFAYNILRGFCVMTCQDWERHNKMFFDWIEASASKLYVLLWPIFPAAIKSAVRIGWSEGQIQMAFPGQNTADTNTMVRRRNGIW